MGLIPFLDPFVYIVNNGVIIWKLEMYYSTLLTGCNKLKKYETGRYCQTDAFWNGNPSDTK